MKPEFSPGDMDEACRSFGAMCGHGALAAAIGERVMTVEHLFERRGGWVNLPQMMRAVGLCPAVRLARQDVIWKPGCPKMKLVLLQFRGPWMGVGIPVAARCQYRHWVAAAGEWVWDSNVGAWKDQGWWMDEILPMLLPKCGEGWEVFRVLVLEDKPLWGGG